MQQAHGLQPSTTLLKKIHRSLHWFPATAAGDINQSSSSRAGAQGLRIGYSSGDLVSDPLPSNVQVAREQAHLEAG